VIARRYVVTGRVQRVGYRLFAQDAAQREGVRGYVRNEPDGSVEVVAEGDASALLRFEMAIRRGPTGAQVDDVQTTWLEPSGQFISFRVAG
jgi:acylphosphatase